MVSHKDSRNDGSRTLKSFFFGLILGILIGLRIHILGSPKAMWSPLEKAIETTVSWVKAASATFGLSEWADKAIDFAFGPALPITAGVIVTWLVATTLRTKKLFGHSLIDRIWPACPDILDPKLEKEGIARYRPLAAGAPFYEREDELALLCRFATDSTGPNVRFLFVTGREGIGKTRLGLEWLKRMKGFGWDVGSLDAETKPLDVKRALFRRKTAILIDEPGALSEFWPILDALLQKKAKIRVILANQTRLHRPDSLDDDARVRIEAGESPPLRLSGLSDSALKQLAPDLADKALAEAIGCPLWVLLKPEHWRELDRRVGLREKAAERANFSRTLALAAMAGPIPRKAVRETLGIYVSTTSLEPLFEDVDRALLESTLPALRPNVFADELLLRDALDYPEEDNRVFFCIATRLNPTAVELRLAGLWLRTNLDSEKAKARALLQDVFDHCAFERVVALRAQVGELVGETAKDLSQDNKGRYQTGLLTAALEELADIADARPFDREIRYQEALGVVNAICHYGTAEDFISLECWGRRLIALADNPAHNGDKEIRLCEAHGAFNAICQYGTIGDYISLERWAARLIALADNPTFVADKGIRLFEAQAAVNAIDGYNRVGDFNSLKRWGARLIALADNSAFAADQEIRLCEAQGATIAFEHYGTNGDFISLERWGARLITLADNPVFVADQEIRACEAQSAVNAIRYYGRNGDFISLERWGGRLIALAENPAFQVDQEIRVCEAKGAYNAICDYGRVGDFISLERWGARLIALAKNPAFQVDQEIRRCEAMGAFNASSYFGRMGDFISLERWGARLIELGDNPAFVADPEIRLCEAKAAVNALHHYGKAGPSFEPRRQFWWRRLAKIARDCPGHSEVQDQANAFDLTYAVQAAKGWPYGAPTNKSVLHNSWNKGRQT